MHPPPGIKWSAPNYYVNIIFVFYVVLMANLSAKTLENRFEVERPTFKKLFRLQRLDQFITGLSYRKGKFEYTSILR